MLYQLSYIGSLHSFAARSLAQNRSGFRQWAPASLTPTKRLNIGPQTQLSAIRRQLFCKITNFSLPAAAKILCDATTSSRQTGPGSQTSSREFADRAALRTPEIPKPQTPRMPGTVDSLIPRKNRSGFRQRAPAALTPACSQPALSSFAKRSAEGAQLWCTGKDSNLRTSLGGTDLQSVGFNHSPTCAETAQAFAS